MPLSKVPRNKCVISLYFLLSLIIASTLYYLIGFHIMFQKVHNSPNEIQKIGLIESTKLPSNPVTKPDVLLTKPPIDDKTPIQFIASQNKTVEIMKGKDNHGKNAHSKYFELAKTIFGVSIIETLPKNFHKSRDIIIGIGNKIDVKYLIIFAASLREVNNNCHLILFVHYPITKEQKDIALKFDIIFLPYDLQSIAPQTIAPYHASSLRWIFLYRFFSLVFNKQKMVENFDRIISVDVRDTYFQLDPFAELHKERFNNTLLVFGEEEGGAFIGNCGWNSGWIKDCFGNNVFDEIQSNPIVCSGLVMGYREPMLEYLNIMKDILLGRSKWISNGLPKCERNGVDQGIHNVIVHKKLLKTNKISMFYHTQYPMLHLQSTPLVNDDFNNMITKFTSNTKDQTIKRRVLPNINIHNNQSSKFSLPLLSSNSQPNGYAIIHQYDRSHQLQLLLAEYYLPWIDWRSPLEDWTNTPTCVNNFHYHLNADLLRGFCDSKNMRVISPGACCQICKDDIPNCSGFAFVNGVCYFKTCSLNEIKTIFKDMVQNSNRLPQSNFEANAISAYSIHVPKLMFKGS